MMMHSAFDHVGPDATTTDRRGAVPRLGALGMAVLAALGLMDAAAKRKRRPKPKVGPPGPPGPPGPTWTSTRVLGDPSPTLGVMVGNAVDSTADCGAPGKLLGGGYIVFHSGGASLANVFVNQATVDGLEQAFTVSLIRTATVASSGGVGVRAEAICRP